MKIKQMLTKIIENGNIEDMYKLNDMFDELICELKEQKPRLYKEYKEELYEIAYGKVLTEEMAHEIVENMKPLGEYWDINTIKQIKSSAGLTYNDYDFYIVMNSLVNDYGEIIDKEDIEIYVKMAKAFIEDEDATKDKIFVYFTTIPE